MSQITYANKIALNENPSIDAINKVRDVDMNEIKTVVNNNETKILIAVSSSAPAQCSIGDMYFNTTSNLIFTATGTNTWGSTGAAPTLNTIYVVFATQTAYAYNGTTLISVGGGASGGGVDIPIGTVIPYTNTTAPEGYLICDGSAVSRTTYSELYDIIGTTYGTGDGSTTFNLPNLKGKVIVMQDTNDTDFDTLGETGGSKYIQDHKHTWASSNGRKYAGGMDTSSVQYGSGTYVVKIDDSSANTGGVFTGSGGVSVGSSGNLQPYIVLTYIIKATKTTPVQAEVVNEYDTSTGNTYSCDFINDCNNYSTSEVNTGKKWIDGKDIYRKVIDTGSITSAGTKNVAHNITNLDKIISFSGYSLRNNDNLFRPMFYTESQAQLQVYADTTNVRIYTSWNPAVDESYVILEYTKSS